MLQHGEPAPEASLRLPARPISSVKLKATLAVFIAVLLIAVSGLLFTLVWRIFARLTPSIRADLESKVVLMATDLAQRSDVGIALGDPRVIGQALREARQDPDLVSVVVTDAAGQVLYIHGRSPEPPARLLAGAPRAIRSTREYLVSWASASVEGSTVGRVALVLSTERLQQGERLRRSILGTAGVGCLGALLVSLFFVSFYLGPLIKLSERSLKTMQEMEIAQHIQVSLLPREVFAPGLELSADMRAADAVGGDYYDAVPTDDGCWLGIGDVAGHGLGAGLVMLMIQSVVSALTRSNPDASPREIVRVLNRVLYENLRHRLGQDEHVTFTLLRYRPDGRIVFAGAHEDIVVWRAATGRCQLVPTPGTWLGGMEDVARATVDSTLKLQPDDIVVLHSDGVTEAVNAAREEFGVERVCEIVERHRAEPVADIRQRIMDAAARFSSAQDDDMTVVVLRYRGAEAS